METYQLHGSSPQPLQTLQKLRKSTGMLCPRPPQTQSTHETQVLGLGYTGGRAVDDSCTGQAVLKLDYFGGCLGAFDVFVAEAGIAVFVKFNCFGLLYK